MDEIDQLKSMRDSAKKRLAEKFKELEQSPDAKLVNSLTALIDDLETGLGLKSSAKEETKAAKAPAKKAPAKKAATAKPKKLSHKELTRPAADKAAEKPAIAEPPEPEASAVPETKAPVQEDTPAPTSVTEPAPETKADEPVATASTAGTDQQSDANTASEPAKKPDDGDMSLEDSLEAELLGDFGKL